MTFARAWVLFFGLLPLAWTVWEWRRSARRWSLLLKAISLVAILLALAEPRLTVFHSKVAVGILADTSASVSPEDLAAASALATGIERARGRNWTRVIPFARTTRSPAPDERQRSWNLHYTAGDAGRATNLEAALREAVVALPAGMMRRLALISDGHENMGSITRAVWQLQQLGIAVDTFPLTGRPKPNLSLESVSVPAQVFSGERFPVDVGLISVERTVAGVEITADGKHLGARSVELRPGLNRFRIHASVTAVGAINLAGSIKTQGQGTAHFEHAITLRRPRVLWLSQDPAGAGLDLLRALEAGQFEMQRSLTSVPEHLNDYQVVVFNNWDLQSVSERDKSAVEEFVRQGGGLLWIAGERNVYIENKLPDDPLERALPAKLAPPRTPEGACVILIIDKSSSMEGKKMDLAKLAAIGVIENLRPVDRVGVLIFDNSFQWAVPVRKAEDRSLLKRLVSGITPDGGTQIAPALTEAFRKILVTSSVYKHVVLLTDGISEEGDSLALAREALSNRVTISTVGLGQDVNRAYLEKIAALSKGNSYFLNDPSGLEQILLKDVQEHSGSTAVEKPLHPVVVKQAEILEGVGIETAPALHGYIRFITKPTADPILNLEKDPLLVRWQYGLGRTAVFTSDAKNRWAADWVGWTGFDRFWSNLFRDLLPHAPESEALADYDQAGEELTVDYRLGRHVELPKTPPDIYVFGPEGFQKPVRLAKVAGGHFRARVSIGSNQGLFRIRPLGESRAFPEVGFYRQEDELAEYGCNEPLLRQIAEATGGRFNPKPHEVFDSGGRAMSTGIELWPGLLAAAVLLNLAELILRKGRGVMVALRQGAATPEPARAYIGS